ncbi:phospholipase [Xenorhabdus sp. Reich]|uniref:Phospholipase n=1 Tax=Xenorhabdus littoralis TaxID=2582835 RepID=A0ABU4SKZ7_9GAMM|nr:phospholipase [Xenorhabdus sp. Reich]MDX7999326.1 phospholipase [Xenorhabdus sp. Reich]
MTLSINTSFSSELGFHPLQNNALQPQSDSPVQPLPNKADRVSSSTISLSENTRQSNALYQSLMSNLNVSTTASPGLNANDIAGKQPLLIDYSLTLVTRDVYRQISLGIGDYVRLSGDDLSKIGIDPETLNDSSTGFQAGVYQNNGLYIVSFTGSNELQDFMVSIRQGLGYKEKQYDQAVELARKALKVFGENVIFTGHSLGGGLATVAALTTGKPAVIYNSVGVSNSTLEHMGISPDVAREMADSGLIRHYTVQHDWLSNLQKILSVPQPMGNEINLEYEFEGIWRYGLQSFKAHFLEAVLELMTEQKPWLSNGDTMLASMDATNESEVSVRPPSLQALAMEVDNPVIREQYEETYQHIMM